MAAGGITRERVPTHDGDILLVRNRHVSERRWFTIGIPQLLAHLSLSLSPSPPLPRNWSHVLAGEGLNGAINQWAAGLGPWFFPPRYLFCRPENDRQQLLRSPRCRSLIFCLPFRARVLQFCTSDVTEFLSPALRCGHCAFGDCPCRCCCNATASASGGRRPPPRQTAPRSRPPSPP